MKKNKFIKSTIILIIGGFFTKILGMIIKIATTRLVGIEGMGLYMLINPTFILFISLSTLGMQTAISKLVSEENRRSIKLISNAIFIVGIINVLILITTIFISPYIANNLLHDKRANYPILAISLVLPFISISSILRGYFFGKNKVFPHVLSNLIEDIIRLISIILFIPFFIKKGIVYAVTFLVLSNIISEVSSIIVLILFLPKKINITKNNLKPNKNNIKDLLDISLPSTGSRLIGSIGMFLEPIILTFFLLKCGFSNDYIVYNYGILNGYVLPLILLPSFFTNAISQALLPIISNKYAKKDFKYVKNKIKQALFYSLLIGIPATILFTFKPNLALNLIYKTNEGINYIKFLAPVFLLHYIQAPLTSSLQAMGKSKIAMNGTFIGMILRTVSLIIFCNLNLGIWSLVLACSINIFYVTIHHLVKVIKYLKKEPKVLNI